MASSGGVGLAARIGAPRPAAARPGQNTLLHPSQNFAQHGWGVLTQPGVAQGYTNAIMNTAQHLPGPHPAAPHPGIGAGHGGPMTGQQQPGIIAHNGLGPASPGNSATTQASAPPPNPLDSTYYANVAGHDFSTNNSINSLNLQGSQDQVGLQTALAQLAHQQPLDQLHLEQGANARGGLYSSVYDQNLGNLNYQYAGKQAAAQNNYANQMASIASRIAALQAGEPIYDDQQAAAAGVRAQQQAQNDPTLGYGTGGLNTTGQPAPQAPAKPPTSISTGRLGSVVKAKPTIKPGSKPKSNPKVNSLAKSISRPTGGVSPQPPKKGRK